MIGLFSTVWWRPRQALFAVILSAFAVLLFQSEANGQQFGEPIDNSEARIDQLEREIQALKTLLQNQAIAPAITVSDPAAIRKLVDQRLKEKEAQEAARKKAEEDAKKAQGHVVGLDRKLNASWDDGGLRFKSADEAFTLHVGGRLMSDMVWWTQTPDLRKTPIQPPGSPLGLHTGVGPGIGDLQDGFFVRRARFVAVGTIFESIDFKVEFDFENNNNISVDEAFVGVREFPFLGMVRIGQAHVPFGLEAYATSRYLPMLERSPLFDAFYQEFAPGIFTNTTFFDQRMTMQHMFHRIDGFSQFNGASFGDGRYAYSGRVSGLPIFESAGRELLHLGLAYQFRKGTPPLDFNGGTVLPSNPNPAIADTTDLIRFRTRAGIRDAVGAQGNNTRVIDTGNIIGDHVQSVNGEVMWFWGSFWVQSETCFSHVDNALFPASSSATSRGNLNYWGTYLQAGYFLTGEQRSYDKPMGKYGRAKPLTNFFMVRDEAGHIRSGPGAWEIAYRYSYLNLNDNSIDGGIYSEHTVGLNWYWNSNIKLQCNYVNGQRSVLAGAASGNVQGIALRAALEF